LIFGIALLATVLLVGLIALRLHASVEQAAPEDHHNPINGLSSKRRVRP
jgi:hypothetical protein